MYGERGGRRQSEVVMAFQLNVSALTHLPDEDYDGGLTFGSRGCPGQSLAMFIFFCFGFAICTISTVNILFSVVLM